MWPTPDPYRWARAVNHGAQLTHRIEVWQGSTLLSHAAPYIDGMVTDEWTPVGVRRNLTLTVLPTSAWRRWFDSGPFVIRPFSGVRFSATKTVEVPLGRFPIEASVQSRPSEPIGIQEDDFYQRVDGAPPLGRVSRTGDILNWLTRLLAVGLPLPIITATARPQSPAVVADGTRHDAIVAAATAMDAEVYCNRLGVPVIEDARRLVAATCFTLAGEALIKATRTPDPGRTFNRVIVRTTAHGVRFPPAIAEITDPTHPAYHGKIGIKERTYASPLMRTRDQAMAAAITKLRRVSGRAVTYTYERLPDATIDAGDTHRGSLVGAGQRNTQVQLATHPLISDVSQTLVTTETQWQNQP